MLFLARPALDLANATCADDSNVHETLQSARKRKADRYANRSSALRPRGKQLLLPRETRANNAHMLREHLSKGRHRCRSRPVPLELRPKNRPGNWDSAGLTHALDRHLVRL